MPAANQRRKPKSAAGAGVAKPDPQTAVRAGDAPWTVAAAKARFSEMIDKAMSSGPQAITRNGKRAAVVVSAEEWERKTRRKGTLLEFFQSAPEGFADLDLERLRDKPRDLDL